MATQKQLAALRKARAAKAKKAGTNKKTTKKKAVTPKNKKENNVIWLLAHGRLADARKLLENKRKK